MKTKNRIWFSPLVIVIMGLLCLAGWCTKDDETNEPSGTITDKDGNVYTSVTIGTQVWMVENLKTTKFNDGTNIPLITDDDAWANTFNSSSPAYCWYKNDASTYKATYGALYNFHAVKTGKLCPTGWHVPTDEEWLILLNFCGGENAAGGKLKETGTTHWHSENVGASNETGFTALPGGERVTIGVGDVNWSNIGFVCCFWTSTEAGPPDWAYYNGTKIVLFHDSILTDSGSIENEEGGESVRCLKDQ
jgi:uncharacterized protein (TIGR02145 family)